MRRKITKAARMTPPTGRLIQKHHLHDTLLVNAPPIRGPIIVEVLCESATVGLTQVFANIHEDSHPRPNQHRLLLGIRNIVDHQHRPAQGARATPALDRTTDDQADAVRCCRRKNAADEEEKDRDDVDDFAVKVFEQLAPHGPGRGDEEEDGRSIPADVVECVELIRYSRDGGGDYALWKK